jgi:Ca2+-binding EF-hand superfamily protein
VESYPEYNHKPALMRAYRAADNDGNGYITRREFKKLLHFICYFVDLWDTFESIDAEGDRRLTAAEFQQASELLGHALSAGEVAGEFDRLGPSGDGSGEVLFVDFCGWCAHRHVGDGFVDSDEEDVECSLSPLPSAQPEAGPDSEAKPSKGKLDFMASMANLNSLTAQATAVFSAPSSRPAPEPVGRQTVERRDAAEASDAVYDTAAAEIYDGTAANIYTRSQAAVFDGAGKAQEDEQRQQVLGGL